MITKNTLPTSVPRRSTPSAFLSRVLTFLIVLGAFSWVLFTSQATGTDFTPAAPAPGQARRIISLMPSQTEILWEIGLGSSVVGVTDNCNFPPPVRSLPRVGGVELNLERIAALRPTDLIDLDGAHRRYEIIFGQMGLRYRSYSMPAVDHLPRTALAMARDLGQEAKGLAFAASWSQSLAAIPPLDGPPKRVYIEIWDAPLQAAGERSLLGELVRRAGGQNILRDSDDEFPVVAAEQIVNLDPEVILLAYPIQDLRKVTGRPGWGDITAVRHGNVHSLNQDLLVRPGPRCLEGIRMLGNILRAAR
jgi:iron complex transport system substrate-binding protein